MHASTSSSFQAVLPLLRRVAVASCCHRRAGGAASLSGTGRRQTGRQAGREARQQTCKSKSSSPAKRGMAAAGRQWVPQPQPREPREVSPERERKERHECGGYGCYRVYDRGFSFLPLKRASRDTPDTFTTCAERCRRGHALVSHPLPLQSHSSREATATDAP